MMKKIVIATSLALLTMSSGAQAAFWSNWFKPNGAPAAGITPPTGAEAAGLQSAVAGNGLLAGGLGTAGAIGVTSLATIAVGRAITIQRDRINNQGSDDSGSSSSTGSTN